MFQNKAKIENVNSGYKFQNLANAVQLDIFGSISNWSYNLATLTNQLADANGKPLLVRLNSYGGEVTEGFAIANLLNGYKGEVTLQIVGYAASIAGVIAVRQKRVQMGKDAFLMIHKPFMSAYDLNAEQLASASETAKMFEEKIINAYLDAIKSRGKFTDITEAKIRQDMAKETWYNAEQSLELGIIDEIVEGVDTLETVAAKYNSLDYYDYFYNKCQNAPIAIKNHFTNNNNKEENMTKKDFSNFLAKLGFVNSDDTTNNEPPTAAEPPAQNESLTTEQAIEHLTKAGYTVTAAEDVLSEEDLQLQIENIVKVRLEASMKAYRADLEKGKLEIPATPKIENKGDGKLNVFGF